MQLVLKALLTIGDLPNSIEAAMVVGVCLDMEEGDSMEQTKEEEPEAASKPQKDDMPDGRRIVRRRSTASK